MPDLGFPIQAFFQGSPQGVRMQVALQLPNARAFLFNNCMYQVYVVWVERVITFAGLHMHWITCSRVLHPAINLSQSLLWGGRKLKQLVKRRLRELTLIYSLSLTRKVYTKSRFIGPALKLSKNICSFIPDEKTTPYNHM